MIKRTSCWVLLIISLNSNCQNLHYYDHYYTSHPLVINPAMSGTHFGSNVSIGYYNQWVGIENAPVSELLTGSLMIGYREFYDYKGLLNKSKVNVKNPVGLGIAIYNDVNGPATETTGLLSYAYHLKLREGTLAFGISGILNRSSYDYDNTHPADQEDPELIQGSEHKLSADANFGILLYKRNWYIGISAVELFQSNYFLGNTNKNKQDYYGLWGCSAKINKQIIFEPSVVITYSNYKSLSIDLHPMVVYKNVYKIGLSYYLNQYIGYNVCLRVYKRCFLGYTYCQCVGNVAGYSSGSHLVSLSFKADKY